MNIEPLRFYLELRFIFLQCCRLLSSVHVQGNVPLLLGPLQLFDGFLEVSQRPESPLVTTDTRHHGEVVSLEGQEPALRVEVDGDPTLGV